MDWKEQYAVKWGKEFEWDTCHKGTCKVCGMVCTSSWHKLADCQTLKIHEHKFAADLHSLDTLCTVCGKRRGEHYGGAIHGGWICPANEPFVLELGNKYDDVYRGKLVPKGESAAVGEYAPIWQSINGSPWVAAWSGGPGHVKEVPETVQTDPYVFKFGKVNEDIRGEELCSVCGLNDWKHVGHNCQPKKVIFLKFGVTELTYSTEDLARICTVCGQHYGAHFGNKFPVCPKNYDAWYAFDNPEKVPAKKTTVVKSTLAKTKKTPKYTPKTQKARGVRALKDYYRQVPTFSIYPATKVEPYNLTGYFVRPCPVVPRHGFVDSRLVSSKDEAETIIKETLAADGEAEFICMPKIDCSHSGIWTPGMLSIGLGNDGATAGTSAKTIPAIGTPFEPYNYASTLEAAGIKTAPYLELLWEKGEEKPWEVQLRDGPSLEGLSTDYIPVETTVSQVVLAEGDLLDWETKVKTLEPGTVIYHPGGTLASHYSIHAVLSKIPVMISRRPEIGEILKQSTETEQSTDIKAIQAGFLYAVNAKMDMKEAAYLMLAGCHHIALWRGKHDILLGAAIGCAYRLTVTAVLGEFRHEGYNTDEGQARYKKRKPLDRNTIYDRVYYKTDSPINRVRFRKALNGFLSLHWSKGFGGESWFRFAQWALTMYNHVVSGDADLALEALNSLVHSAHNNGWGFNKFIGDAELDKTAADPVYALMRCAPLMYEALDMPGELVLTLAAKFKKYRRKIKPIEHNIDLSSKLKQKQAAHVDDDGEDSDDGCDCLACTGIVTDAAAVTPIRGRVIKAQAKLVGNKLHIQYVTNKMPAGKFYYTTDHTVPSEWKGLSEMGYKNADKAQSLSGGFTEYAVITIESSKSWNLNSDYFFRPPIILKTKRKRIGATA